MLLRSLCAIVTGLGAIPDPGLGPIPIPKGVAGRTRGPIPDPALRGQPILSHQHTKTLALIGSL